MSLDLTRQAIADLPSARHPHEGDEPALATLMLAAYAGTIDSEEGDTYESALSEVQKTFAGDHGVFLPACSWVDEHDGVLHSACLVNYFESWQGPIIAFVMTAPEAKGQGLAKALMRRSMNDLLDARYTQVHLAVTEGNEPAQSIYRSLGFVTTETWG